MSKGNWFLASVGVVALVLTLALAVIAPGSDRAESETGDRPAQGADVRAEAASVSTPVESAGFHAQGDPAETDWSIAEPGFEGQLLGGEYLQAGSGTLDSTSGPDFSGFESGIDDTAFGLQSSALD